MNDDGLNATLIERHDLSQTLSVVRVSRDGGRVPDFTPGQFITLGLPRERPPAPPGLAAARPKRVALVKRAYSIASAARQTDAYELFVLLVAEGKLTPRMWTLRAGDRLWMDEQTKGEFTLAGVPVDQDLVMISTGTGIAPFMSMLRSYRGEHRWRRLILINGVRHVGDLGYREELEALCRQDSTVRYCPVVSRATSPAEWSGWHGHVQVALEEPVYSGLAGSPLDPERCHVFLCGNPAMLDDVEPRLVARGFHSAGPGAAGNLHVERYW